MIYKSCRHIEEGINFFYNGIRFCNTLWGGPQVIEYNSSYDDIFDKIVSSRNILIANNQKGNLLPCCVNCRYLEEKDWNNDGKISYITVYHWLHCNCGCFYCSNRDDSKLVVTNKIQNSKQIVLYPLIEKFHKKKIFADNLNVDFVGGEPTLLKEFPKLVNLFIKNNANMGIPTNAIIYNKIINKALNCNDGTNTTISIDSGNRETYKKIKKVDAFDRVVSNIKKYLINSPNKKGNIYIKYILLNGINDNFNEINNWLDLCEKIGVRRVFPSIEFCHSAKVNSEKLIDENIAEKYHYIKEEAIKRGFYINSYSYIDELIETGAYNISNISVKQQNARDNIID